MDTDMVPAAPVPGPSTPPRPTMTPISLHASATFSFTAPYPASVSQPPPRPPVSVSTPTSPHSLKQQRRVSLALPSSPRQFPAWSFRDDTTLRFGAAAALAPEKKGKIRRIADDGDVGAGAESFAASFGIAPLLSLSASNNVLQPPTPSTALPAENGSSAAKSSKGVSTPSSDPPKKPRKKWTMEETQMLVNGCNKWGVGNWKAILNDPELTFDNRSPVDLKDRFRTYFPDAYKHHYPNARTHLPSASSSAQARSASSLKSRSLLPDGSPLFLSSRQKKRRPFTPEEDRALKEGYDKHGTVWATIVKDPVFKEQGRRSTDLRDRFRNAWPELYAKAGYKPRAHAAKKKKADVEESPPGETHDAVAAEAARPASEPASATLSTVNSSFALANPAEKSRGHPVRAATDDQLPTAGASSGIGPVRRKRRHTTQGFGLFRGGTKSVPGSSANSEDEGSDEDEPEWDGAFDSAKPTVPVEQSAAQGAASTSESPDGDVEMSSQESGLHDFLSSSSLSMSDLTDASSQAHASWPELDTPLHPWTTVLSSSQSAAQSQPADATSSAAFADSLAASPTSTDYFLPTSPNAPSNTGMIGKSAWGTQDWLSANPRLDASGGSLPDGFYSPSPMASPSLYSSGGPTHPLSLAQLSFSHLALASSSSSQSNPYSHNHSSHLHSQAYSHGVMDRYDLFPPSSHLHHSSTDDDFDIDTLDLDFISEGFEAASSDVHSAFSDPSSAWATGGVGPRRGGFTHHSNYAGDLIFGARTHQPARPLAGLDYGLGFGFGSAGMGLGLEGAPAPSVLHTPALPGIDEIELAAISLNDPLPSEKDDVGMSIEEVIDSRMAAPSGAQDAAGAGEDAQDQFPPLSLDDIVGIPLEPEEEQAAQGVAAAEEPDTSHHITPPATPANTFRVSSRAQGGLSLQHRSVSVPPSEHRAFLPPPRSGQSQMTSPKAKYKSLMMTPTRSTFAVPQLPTSTPLTSTPLPAPSLASPSPPSHLLPSSAPNPTPAPWPPSDADNDLPFLDLHYYTSADAFAGPAAFSVPLGAQALDLAQTLVQHQQAAAAHKQLCVPPSLIQPMLGQSSAGALKHAHTRPASAHTRGQSAVSPQDLFVRKGGDNKRKRASWDGGPK